MSYVTSSSRGFVSMVKSKVKSRSRSLSKKVRRDPPEEWRGARGFPNYVISSRGRLRNKSTGRILTPRLTPEGYVTFRIPNSHHVFKNVRAHRLVAIAFVPNPHRLPSVHHLNFVTSDNRVANLQWASYKTQIALRRPWGQAATLSLWPIITRKIERAH